MCLVTNHRDFSINEHRAGSVGDETLGKKVHGMFKQYGMKTWTDEHFIKVQDGPSTGFNRIVLTNGEVEKPTGFLSYSATGRAEVIDRLN